MLTGPVTLLQWSFPRTDISKRAQVCHRSRTLSLSHSRFSSPPFCLNPHRVSCLACLSLYVYLCVYVLGWGVEFLADGRPTRPLPSAPDGRRRGPRRSLPGFVRRLAHREPLALAREDLAHPRTALPSPTLPSIPFSLPISCNLRALSIAFAIPPSLPRMGPSLPPSPSPHQAFQLAQAVRAEVQDLEAAGCAIIQVDEPALREGLPLKQDRWAPYLAWAVDAFLLTTAGVRPETQIVSHLCYSDFGACCN